MSTNTESSSMNNKDNDNNNNILLLRQLSLVQPTVDVPWSIDAISAIPKDVMDNLIICDNDNNNNIDDDDDDNNGTATGAKNTKSIFDTSNEDTSTTTVTIINDSNRYSTGCSYGRWYATVTIDYKIFVWYDTEAIITSTTSTSGQPIIRNRTLYERKFTTPYCILSHNNELLLQPLSDTTVKRTSTNHQVHGQQHQQQQQQQLLIAMTSAEHPSLGGTVTSTGTSIGTTISDSNSVYIYCANPITGALLLWKVSRDDLTTPRHVRNNNKHNSYSKLFDYKCNIFSVSSHPNSNIITSTRNDNHHNDTSSPNNNYVNGSHQYLTCIDVTWVTQNVSSLQSKSTTDTIDSSSLQLLANKGSPCIVIGTSHGDVYWITQSHVPISLHIRTVNIFTDIYDKYYQRSNSTIVSTLIERFFTSTPASKLNRRHNPFSTNTKSKRRKLSSSLASATKTDFNLQDELYNHNDDDDDNDDEDETNSLYHIVSIQLLRFIQLSSQQKRWCYSFLTTTRCGDIICWDVYPTETLIQSYISGSVIVGSCIDTNNTFDTLLKQYCVKYKADDTTTISLLSSQGDNDDDTYYNNNNNNDTENNNSQNRVVVLRSTTKSVITSSDEQNNDNDDTVIMEDTLVSIVLAIVPRKSRSSTISTQWYWVQARIRRCDNDSKQSFQILQVEWLNRFSSSSHSALSLRVYGCTIADNNVAYAAAGFANQPVVLMALPFPKLLQPKSTSLINDDGDGDDDANVPNDDVKKNQQNNEMLSVLSSSLLEQYELPSHQSLLYNIFAPDIATTGISALDESGLGIRIRYISPTNYEKQQQQQQQQNSASLLYTTTTNKSLRYRQHFVIDRHMQNRSVPILINFLYALHRESYIKPDGVLPVPIVISKAIGTIELEQAIVQYGERIMNTSDFFTSGNASYYSVPSDQYSRNAETDEMDYNNNNTNTNNDDEDQRNVTADFRRRLSLSPASTTREMVDALTLQQQGNSVTSNTDTYTSDLMEWHIAYLRFLQQTGIYKTLSDLCKWQLLQIGQQITAYQAICSDASAVESSTQNSWQLRQLSELRIYNVADWLYSIQRTVISGQNSTGEDQHMTMLRWMCLSLDAAMSYREEYAIQYYDIVQNQPPMASYDSIDDVPIWTCKSSIQSVLLGQLQYWSQSSLNYTTATLEQIERVVQWSLISFCDTYVCCGSEIPSTQKHYATCQQVAIDLIRTVYKDMNYNRSIANHGDELAFELSQAHNYFDGMCQIAYDHEHLSDANAFALLPFLTTSNISMIDKKDVGSQELFPKHVLMWHIKKKLFGKVLHYGQYCPNILEELMDTEDVLKPYRWIFNVKCQRNYQSAADNIVDCIVVSSSSKNDVKTDLSIASLCTSVMEKQLKGQAQQSKESMNLLRQRRRFLDQRMELVNAQEELTGMKKLSSNQLMSPKELLDNAIGQLRDLSYNVSNSIGDDDDNRASVAFIALAICPTFENPNLLQDAVVFVWYESILSDEEQWINDFMKYPSIEVVNDTSDIDTTFSDRMLHTTVFGQLYQNALQVVSSSSRSNTTNDDNDIDESKVIWSRVILYNSVIEQQIFEKLVNKRPYLLTDKLRRLLQLVVMAAGENSTTTTTTDFGTTPMIEGY